MNRRPSRAFILAAVLMAVCALVLVSSGALATHGDSSLAGSNFEIDNDANLKVDHAAPPSLDWANVLEERQEDQPTGRNDDSYAGGSKEDDACPGTTTGSIPNNKSDLLTFGVYVEPGDPGFLHVFWSRVNEPTGTTLMDFEFNQSSADCGNGVNPVRTVGDLLLEYRIEQGGATAELKIREWTGAEWGSAQDLTAQAFAVGTINNTAIPFAESDALIPSGELSPRTFGEASIDLDFVFDPEKCLSFGSAFLKSRASDSFTSQLKDYIAPVPVDIQNCGEVIIRKQTDPDEDPNATEFGFSKTFATDPATANTFVLKDDDTATFNNVLFGTGYQVAEDVVPFGWDFDSVDCSASSGVTPSISSATITFDIDNASDVLDCTYYNEARGTIIVEKITSDGFGAFDFTSNTLTPASFTLTTTAAGAAGKDSETFSDLAPGTYDVAETVPTGWNLTSATCDDGSSPGTIALSAGETVTCTFTNERQKGAIKITKTRKHAADGPGDHPHAGVDFTITGGELPVGGVTVTSNASGETCYDGLVLSSFAGIGDYTVTESVPSGYVADGATAKAVTVSTESTCGDGNEATVSFSNTPLTDITVSVDSLVPGGTQSIITCYLEGDPENVLLDSVTTDADGAGEGDGTLTLYGKLPGTYTCTIVVDP